MKYRSQDKGVNRPNHTILAAEGGQRMRVSKWEGQSTAILCACNQTQQRSQSKYLPEARQPGFIFLCRGHNYLGALILFAIEQNGQ